MSAKFQLTILLSAAMILIVAAQSSSIKEDNKKSTMKIMGKACVYPRIRSDEQAQQFMDCYDAAPGKEIFMACMEEAFGQGNLFSTRRNFVRNCAQPWKIPSYASCLNREFEAAGIDQDDAVFKVNECQLPVVSQ